MITLRRLIAGTAIAAAVAGGGVAFAGGGTPSPPWQQPQPKDKAAARHIRLERQAIDLINKASAAVRKADKACAWKPPSLASKPTHDAPSQGVLDAIAALRRPATPAELAEAKKHRGFGGETYVDYIRDVTTAEGHPFTILIGRRVRSYFTLPSRCYDEQHHWLVQHLAGKPRRLRSVTLEEFSHLRQGQEANEQASSSTPVDGIYLMDNGGGGGGADIAQFKERGVFSSSGSRLNGLVPDGVASITFEFPKTISHGEDYKPTVFDHAITRTVAVHENVVAFDVGRPAPYAFPHRMLWRDASGAVIHTFTDPAF